jgi:hypothetical protein
LSGTPPTWPKGLFWGLPDPPPREALFWGVLGYPGEAQKYPVLGPGGPTEKSVLILYGTPPGGVPGGPGGGPGRPWGGPGRPYPPTPPYPCFGTPPYPQGTPKPGVVLRPPPTQDTPIRDPPTQDLGVGYPGPRGGIPGPPSRYPPYPGGVSRDPPYPGGVPRTQGGYPGPTQGGYLGSPRRSSGRSARLIKSPTWGTPLRTRDDGFHPALDWATHAVSASDPKGPNLVAMGTPKVVLGCLRPQDLRQGGRGLLVPTAGPPGPVLGLQRAFYPQELAFSGTPLGKNSQRLLDPSAFIPRCVFCSPTDYN